MKTEWDYSELAQAYLKRPNYSAGAIDRMLEIAGLGRDAVICDVGAGVGHLTIQLAERGYTVVALEPNDAMRSFAEQRLAKYQRVSIFEAIGEETGQRDQSFEMVTFGSSFNVTDRQRALQESARILKDGGWFACMWNHRDLTDSLQAGVEKIIHDSIEDYSYGSRREDQTEIINASGLFGDVLKIEEKVMHAQSKDECVEAWRSHATLQRQAGDRFDSICDEIERLVGRQPGDTVQIPYNTKIWMAQKR